MPATIYQNSDPNNPRVNQPSMTAVAETVTGSAADDIVDVQPDGLSANDTIDLLGGTSDTLRLIAAGTMNLTLPTSIAGVENLLGSGGDDIFILSQIQLNRFIRLDGAAGYDILQFSTAGTYNLGALGLQVLNIEEFRGSAGVDSITGTNAADRINGDAGNDTLTGGAGNDFLDGGANNDTMFGGVGNDIYVVDTTSDIANETGDTTGDDEVQSWITFSLANALRAIGDIERLTLLGTGNINGTGNAFANVITGNVGNNTLDGGAGADRMIGGLGDDTYVIDNAGDVIVENAGEGTDTIRVAMTFSLANFANVEKLVLTGTGAFDLVGNDLDNTLIGNSANNRLEGGLGNDTLTGGAGNDTMIGGAGDDVYDVTEAGDTIQEDANAGTDIVRPTFDYTLGANLDSLYLQGTGNINGTGNELGNGISGTAGSNILTGLGGSDTLNGRGGADIMIGGVGNDMYMVDDAGDQTNEVAGEGYDYVRSSISWTLARGNNIESIGLLDVAVGNNDIDATGNELDNAVSGNSGRNTLSGLEGNDTIDGGLGDDILLGGDGDDILRGGDGNDRLDGGNGIDTADGGLGDDTYVVTDNADTISDTGATGTDTVEAYLSFTLLNNPQISGVENITLGGNAHIDATGDANANVLTGNVGNNALDGGAGADRLVGGAGNDVYTVDNAGDVVVENPGEGDDEVRSSITWVLAAEIERLTLIAPTGNLNGTGNALDNTLTGNGGNNRLDGGAGNDRLVGGAGNDTYVVDSLLDVIVENPGQGTDTVETALGYSIALLADVENLTLTGAGNVDATGNSAVNLLIGNSGNNRLDGGAGADTMRGMQGNDVYVVDNALDVADETGGGGTDEVVASVSYTLGQNLENLTLAGAQAITGTGNTLDNIIAGNSANNTLTGLGGNDRLIGNGGTDTLAGGIGDDTYVIDANDILQEGIGEGTDTVEANFSYTLLANFENLTLTGVDNIDGTGNSAGNTITGNDGNNRLDGGAGADTLRGGRGNDIYVVDDVNDTIVELAGEGYDTVFTSVTFNAPNTIERVILQGTADINITADAGDNTLTGNDGNNRLDGGAGNDTMAGGRGNDTYMVDSLQDTVTENPGEGEDTIESWLTYSLANLPDIENLTLLGTSDIDATGNGSRNVLTGNSGANRLDGGAGADTMRGGRGNDIYIVDDGNDVVDETGGNGTDEVRASVSYTLAAGVEHLTLTGTADIDGTGNAGDNTLTGNSGNNVLTGMAGNDRLIGNGGTDTLAGGLGDDTYVIDANDVLREGVGEGTDTVEADFGYTLLANFENLTLTGNGNIDGTGNAASNIITGNDGNNTLDGGAGADTLRGGRGNDIYIVDDAGDVVDETNGDGVDEVRSSVNHTLLAGFENLTLTGNGSISGTGNAGDNIITGNDGDNRLDGAGGADTLRGGLGNDTYVIDATDTIQENANEGTDTVEAGFAYTLGVNLENLTLTGNGHISGTGNAADNIITGNGGNNRLDGGAGADTLRGGLGDDTYVVDAADTVEENANEGTDTVEAGFTYTLGANLENLTLTGNGNISGTGNTLANTITGNDGNNTLDGGAGADTLRGGRGNDIYVVDDAGDVVDETGGDGNDEVRSSLSYTLGAGIENLTLTGNGNISGTGNTLANIIAGNDGNNTLDGGAGADTLRGGRGNDIYVIDDAGDVVDETGGDGDDEVRSAITYVLGAGIERLTLLGVDDKDATGNTLANTITGNDGNNTLDGGAGADTLRGGRGNDIYIVDNAGDVVDETGGDGVDEVRSSVSYTLGAGLENLTLTGNGNIDGTGNTLANTITGNDGDNRLNGGGGADTLRGGRGDDTYVVDAADTIDETANEGTDTVEAGFTYTLGANLENLTLTGNGNIDGTGNTLANTITGNDGNNTLDGGAGADTLRGGRGNDIYIVDDAGDVVDETGGDGNDEVRSSVSYTLGAGIENLTLTGNGNISGTGNAADNIITGNDGNNTLDGGAGADTLRGGRGNDIYIVDDAGDVVDETGGDGNDEVRSSISHTLGAGLENLTLTGNGNISGTGNTLANTITGNDGNNTLDGGAGADTLRGGRGNDIYIVDDAGDVVDETGGDGNDEVRSSISYTLGAGIENLTLTGNGNVDGTGNAASNIIVGNDGNNTLEGGAGADTLRGGRGNDIYIVDNAGDVVDETNGDGVDEVRSSVSYTLGAGIENLTLTGNGNISGTGNTLANTITGNDGNNTLDGGAGADTLRGGPGNDIYIVDDAGDVVDETGGDGNDEVRSSISYTLGAGIENLTLTGNGNIDGTGNTLANTITGNDGNNTLDGGAGADTLRGGRGNDIYIVDDAGDVVDETGGDGNDEVRSSISYTLGAGIENLTLTGNGNISGTGNTLANTITGNDGNNTLDGGAGADTLRGGRGNDIYIVDDAGDVVDETGGDGDDEVRSAITYVLGADIENLTLTGNGNISGTGNTLVNTITGNDGNNTLDGGAGADTLRGGRGNDIYIVDNAGDVVDETGGDGDDEVRSSISYTLGAGIENLTLTGNGNISGTGNTLVNTITGNDANNTLDGGAGADTLRGGRGNDIYILDDAGDVVDETGGDGVDEVRSSISYILLAGIENLTLTGNGNISGTGNAADNIITGNDGNNTLDGGAGADTLRGGRGNDIYILGAGDTVEESANEGTDTVEAGFTFTLGDNVENLTLTGNGNIDGTGNAANNIITGNGGNNRLEGGAGDDTLIGGAGNDVYVVDSAGDSVVENAREGTDTVLASVGFSLASLPDVENLTLTGSANIDATGNGLDNTLIGNDGNNRLDGGAGADVMKGGKGNDTYIVDNAGDVVDETGGNGSDEVLSSVNYTLGTGVENLTLTGHGDIDGTGNVLDNVITGNDGNNTLDGGGGADRLVGGDGDDVYYVDDINDVVVEEDDGGEDTVYTTVPFDAGPNIEHVIYLNAQNLDFTGGAGPDRLFGTDGDNLIDGAGGDDVMIGRKGNDTYVVDSAGDQVVERADEGTDTIEARVSFTLSANVENLRLMGTGDLDGTGNELANIITGNDGNNTLDGGAGADTLRGGKGSDIYIVDDAGDVVDETGGDGVDEVRSSVSYTLGAGLENLTLTGAGNNSGTGNDLSNIIIGNDGSNLLDGGAGADTLRGGLGDDIYIVDNEGDVVDETGGDGVDEVRSSLTYRLQADIEKLTLLGSGNIGGTGNGLDNVLTGNEGDNVLDGGAGADRMKGGRGNDTYFVDDAGDTVDESDGSGVDEVRSSVGFVLGAGLENLVLLGTVQIDGTGNDLDNRLTGNSGDNHLIGLEGNDTLDGGGGRDVLEGGNGDDTYVLRSGSETIVEGADAGNDTISAAITCSLLPYGTVENLTLTGSAAINGTGNALANVLIGNRGNNRLDGGAGADLLKGGLGNDTYVVDRQDRIVEFGNEGSDTVFADFSYVLGANLENLVLTGRFNLTGTGNELDNRLTGNSGRNLLSGGLGNDWLDGQLGADRLIGGRGNDTYVIDRSDVIVEKAGEGTDTVIVGTSYTLWGSLENLILAGSSSINGTGTADNNRITGNNGENRLTGLAGNDTLIGNGGRDTLIGGRGNDVYVIDASDVIVENANEGTDTIISGRSYRLLANFENLTLSGTQNLSGTGNSVANIINGNAGNNVLDGGAGADVLRGGRGNDTYIIDSVLDVIDERGGNGVDWVTATVSVSLDGRRVFGDVEHVRLTGNGDISASGNALNNTLIGNGGKNVLSGGEGNDWLSGGGGEDRLIGGKGNDTYVVDALDGVREKAGEGLDTVIADFSYRLFSNFENLVLAGKKAINGTGNELANVIRGNDAANVLDGRGGKDTLIGGRGNDTYFADAQDILIEKAGGGVDTVIARFDCRLADQIENLVLLDRGSFRATGNNLNNVITGNSGGNRLDGAGGNDTIIGGRGKDILIGGLGNDVLTGGIGKDTFVFDARPNAVSNIDRILDFNVQDDTIQLENRIFTRLGVEGALSKAYFTANSAGVARDSNDYLIYNTKTGALLYDADGNGSGSAVQFAWLSKGLSLTHADFSVI
ncbi:hypothetical protein [Gellertiella hungarica]|uniref:Ca2+-binding RTX toxin-like protein n=1 Tax=Gellertiella hungarica TaxID=1572859 RepID=A0A7W6J2E1_9HYPH|nr:hypothetical protein [Gellertiella hungarica]MBB4063508.1 Ca2+-binding RTX toxin-like protein [Gellertiella hungarica]